MLIMRTAIIVILILATVYIFTQKSENFIETTKSTIYKKPSSTPDIDYNRNFDDSKFTLSSDSITPDEIEQCMILTVKFIKKESGLCVSPIETNKVELYKNTEGVKLYKCRIMMMAKNVSFPFGFMINVNIFNNSIVLANTQSLNVSSDITPFEDEIDDNFFKASELLPKPKSF
jgi:hypothetical protein